MHLCNPMACQYSYHLHIPSFASVPRRKSTLQPRLYLPESIGLEPTKEQRRNHQTTNVERKKLQACALSTTCYTNHEEHTAANIRLTNPLPIWAGLDRGLERYVLPEIGRTSPISVGGFGVCRPCCDEGVCLVIFSVHVLEGVASSALL
jgi:hypothetical protein